MSRQLCTCCLKLPFRREQEQPFAIETPSDRGRVTHPLCPACIVFVGEEIAKKTLLGGGFKIVESAIEAVAKSYENGARVLGAKLKTCFVTVCGGGEDYEFLLGSIEHHAQLGTHLVLDTTPINRGARSFRNLPESVLWVYEPSFGHGWDKFRFAAALNRAVFMAELMLKPDVIVQLDCDDFFTLDSGPVFEMGLASVVELQYVHWRQDGNPYLFGESEWHRRIWPARNGITVKKGDASRVGPYKENPEVHPKLEVPDWVKTIRVGGLHRHHLHFAIGEKASDETIAASSITGWPHGGTIVAPCTWPAPLVSWRDLGILPSEKFK